MSQVSMARIRGIRALVAAVVMAVVLLAGSGCKNTNFIGTKEEVRMGRDAAKEIEARYRVETKGADAERVARLSERLLVHADTRPGVPYSYRVLDVKDVNAVSLPGGPIYVFKGLLDMVGDDDDALACIMAHELAHTNERHAAKQISQQMLATIGIGVFVRGGTAQNIAGMVNDLMSLSYSRDDEDDADRHGISYAYKAGFDPRGMPRFFAKLQALEKGGGDTPVFLRTHPLTKMRIDKVNRIIENQDYRYGH